MTAEADSPTSLSFTEEMKGFVAMSETDFQLGREEGKKTNTALMFHLTITMDDVARFVEDPAAEIGAAGIITIHELDFLKQLTTFRVKGPNLAAKADAVAQFGKLFLGSLWDVYGSKIPLPHRNEFQPIGGARNE